MEVEVDDSARQLGEMAGQKKRSGTSLPDSGAGKGGARVKVSSAIAPRSA